MFFLPADWLPSVVHYFFIDIGERGQQPHRSR